MDIIAFPNLMRYTKILTPDSSKPKILYLTTMGIAILIITQILGGNLGKSNVGFLQDQRSLHSSASHLN
ncbi:hypothetical protein OA58_07100 [Microcystis aeruginosa NIES-88]|nr:hypothetical protein OA58_07100 [Microcystis aeruginosa NIES-88]